jgi:hypothetical protein
MKRLISIFSHLRFRLAAHEGRLRQCVDDMIIAELRNIANGLANRASRVAAGRKQGSINRGGLAIERLYGYANDTLPRTVVGLSLKGEPETWVNIARLAGAIVTACDQIEPPTPAAALGRGA